MRNKEKIVILIALVSIIILILSCSNTSKTQLKKNNCIKPANASPLDRYRIEFAHAVLKNWITPNDIGSETDVINTSIVFNIMPDGSVKDIFVVGESGNKALDESAIKAIKSTDPFKPYPKTLTVPYVEMGLRFNPCGVN